MCVYACACTHLGVSVKKSTYKISLSVHKSGNFWIIQRIVSKMCFVETMLIEVLVKEFLQ